MQPFKNLSHLLLKVLTMRKILYLFSAFLLSAILFSGCDNQALTGKKLIKITSSSCKQFTESAGTDSIAQDQDCVEFTYLPESKTLKIKHLNAAFNCCPDKVFGEISIDSNIITIVEKEKLTDPCKCNCLYDLDYELTDIEAGNYIIRITEAYLNDVDEKLEATLDLNKSEKAEICKKRTSYPWIF